MRSRRRIFLINRSFQLRFAFYVCSWVIAFSFVYPLIISNIFDFLFSYLVMDPNGPEISYLENTRQDLLWLLIIMQAVMLILSFCISIFMSHRVAGPLYKLSMFFREAKAGNALPKISFRKKDYFPELATEYNEMMESIRSRMDRKTNAITSSASHLEQILTKADSSLRRDIEAVLSDLRKAEKT